MRKTGASALAASAFPAIPEAAGQEGIPLGERPDQASEITILNPRGRVPVSFIIDDSTCLVNMAHFAMPQFSQTWPERKDYQKNWRQWPREIPDAFVRRFGEWCREHGVKGKYSIVPCPALVGWVDRELPGWSRRELQDSLKLVRDLLLPDWDIHPEMVTHTRAIDIKTGRPFDDVSPAFMENWGWTDGKSIDELAAYSAYALRILRNVDLPCEGVTTPGGYAGRVQSAFSQAARQAVRDVFPEVTVPHYFKYLETGAGSTQPRVEHVSGLDSADPQCVVNVLGSTGDWFGGWDGVSAAGVDASADRFITETADAGRMVELIERDEPALMLCHWPGIYCNGEETGFHIFQKTVTRLHAAHRDRIQWMKLSEIAAYWAAKELTAIGWSQDTVTFEAPFAAENFTCEIPSTSATDPKFTVDEHEQVLKSVKALVDLRAGTWLQRDATKVVCLKLPKGKSRLKA